MASLGKKLFICVLHKDNVKSSEFLMSNVWLMSDEVMGRKEI